MSGSRRTVAQVSGFALAAMLSLAFQSNSDPNTDLTSDRVAVFEYQGRVGTYPHGEAAFSPVVELCNYGYFHTDVPVLPPMSPLHPFAASLAARERDLRFEQISDYSFVYHIPPTSWFSNCFDGCPIGSGGFLWTGCSADYPPAATSQRLYLGPAEEIDPWLGTWIPTGSLFDGIPVDGQRDFFGDTSNAVSGRLRIKDFLLSPAIPHPVVFQTLLVVSGEPEISRADNLAWYATMLEVSNGAYGMAGFAGFGSGSILNAWYGSEIASGTNGGADGRVYVANRTRQVGALTKYEYAVHNRDNSGGVGEIRIPLAPGSTVSDVRFRDIDGDATNDWTWSVANDELVFTTANNPLRWNSIYNLGFDSAASPVPASIVLGQYSGAGVPHFQVAGRAPLGATPPPCSFGEDALEPNDALIVSKDIGLGHHSGLTLQLDDPDWYRFVLPAGNTLRVEATALSADVRLELFRTHSNFVPLSVAVSDSPDLANETTEFQNALHVADTLYICVKFVPRSNTPNCGGYDLTVRRNGFIEEPEVFCLGDGSLTPCPCGNNALGSSHTSKGGCRHATSFVGALLRVPPESGAPSQSADELVLDLYAATRFGTAHLISARNSLPQAGCFQCGIPAFDGLRCIGGDLRRLQVVATDSGGNASFGAPFVSLLGKSGFVAGQSALFTVFYSTDPTQTCFTGQNASNALRVLIVP